MKIMSFFNRASRACSVDQASPMTTLFIFYFYIYFTCLVFDDLVIYLFIHVFYVIFFAAIEQLSCDCKLGHTCNYPILLRVTLNLLSRSRSPPPPHLRNPSLATFWEDFYLAFFQGGGGFDDAEYRPRAASGEPAILNPRN